MKSFLRHFNLKAIGVPSDTNLENVHHQDFLQDLPFQMVGGGAMVGRSQKDNLILIISLPKVKQNLKAIGVPSDTNLEIVHHLTSDQDFLQDPLF